MQSHNKNNETTTDGSSSNIELAGFKDIKPEVMVTVKKNIDSYLKGYSDIVKNIERVHITLKPIHKTGDIVHMYHFNAKLLYDGKAVHAEVEDRTLLAGLDTALGKIDAELKHHMHKK